MTRQQWKNAIDFSHAVGGEIVTSFAFSPGTRNANDEWTPDQARRFVAFTKSAGGKIAAAEFMNEPNYAAQGGAPKGYDAAMYGRDVQAFAKFFHESLPRSLFVGPGSTGEGGVLGSLPTPGKLQTEDLLKATGPAFDVFSYHIYAAVSQRCAAAMPAIGTTEAAALTRDWLLAPLKIHAFYAALRDRYLPGKPMWVTEVADAGCGGNPWASTFRDTFRYVNQMGMLARKGVKMIAHNTLASSDYGLLDEKTFTPRPNYWAAVLWQRLMGQIVLDPGTTADGDLYVYAQCMRDSRGGVTFMAINPGNSTRELQAPMAGERYTLTAKELGSATVELNGRALEAKADATLPAMQGSTVGAGQLQLAPASITFLTFPKAGNKACR
ncbi:MAG TPA: hypothetical protein VHW24_15005 [Bryobacteraceae bacterium]|nr:hypothetical protein [Bryobacteraceae bacterium]